MPKHRNVGSGWLLALALLTSTLQAAEVAKDNAAQAIQEMREAATRFLAALDPAQKERATFEFKNEERYNWHFIPRERKGLPFKEMLPFQRPLGMALVNSALSHRAQLKAAGIMSLEQILLELEQGKGPKRDPEMYFISIFGAPSANQTWGWRIEGHHLAMNFTIAHGTQFAGTPSFLGSNPAKVKQGPRADLRVLGNEEDLGRKLLLALTPTQQKTTIYTNTAPADIFTSATRKVTALQPIGILAADLTTAQKELLKGLVREYVERLRPELAAPALQKIDKAGWGKLRFAWAGGSQPGEAHYYRVQGPTFILEYDNIQNNNNHVHATWRDFDGDFGDDLLARHYQHSSHGN